MAMRICSPEILSDISKNESLGLVEVSHESKSSDDHRDTRENGAEYGRSMLFLCVAVW